MHYVLIAQTKKKLLQERIVQILIVYNVFWR